MSVAPAERLVRELFAAIDEQDATRVEPLIHPDASLEMAMARGEEVRGREAVMATLHAAWERVHSLSIHEVQPLSHDDVVIEGRSRHPTPLGGFADTGVVWLCEWRRGMLWRQRLFPSAEEARAAWEREHLDGSCA